MAESTFLTLVQNAALLLGLVLVFDTLRLNYHRDEVSTRQTAAGVLIGAIGICLMLTPWVLMPGVIFDTRSVLLSVSGLFFGAYPTLIAMGVTVALRIYQGGAGALTGVLVILATGSLGIAWHRLRKQSVEDIRWHQFYLFGVLTHLVMLALMFTLPRETAWKVLSQITLPVLAIYPLGTAALGMIFARRMQREHTSRNLMESEERLKQAAADLQKSREQYRILTENIKDVVWTLDVESLRYLYMSPSVERLRGFSVEETMAQPVRNSFVHEVGETVHNLIQKRAADLLAGKISSQDFFTEEAQQLRKDGSSVWAEIITSYYVNPENGRVEVRGVTRDITERKQAQEALLVKSEVLDAALDGIAVADMDGLLTYVNPAFLRMWGYPQISEVLGRPAVDFWQADALAPEVLEAVCRDGFWEGEMNACRKDGTQFLVQVSTTLVKDASGRPVCSQASFVDITERRQAEEALRQSEVKFRSITEQTSDLISLTDTAGIITYASPAARQIFGMEPEEMCGRHFWEFLEPSSAPQALAYFQSAVERGETTRSLELQMKRKDGSLFTGELNGSRFQSGGESGTLVVIRDVSERRQAEDALIQEKLLTDAILASVPGMLYLYDDQGHLLRWNKRHEEMTGYSAEELDHFYLLDWYKGEPEDIERVTQGVQKALTEGFASAEANLITKSGKTILCDFTAVRVDIGGKVYFTGIGIDITERRKAEDKVRAAQAELQRLLAEAERSRRALLSLVEDQKDAEERIRQLNRDLEQRVADRTALLTAANQELEAFAYSVSHDLRGPLRAMDGFSAALLDDYAGQVDEQGRQYLLRIRDASQRMGHLIDDLLNLSRVTRSEFSSQLVDLSALARSIAEELASQAPERRVDVDIQPGMTVRGDPSLLKIAMQNLLQNAFKFTGKCERPSVRVGVQQQDGSAVYFVGDNGAGFNMEYAGKLFTPFQRLHGAQEFPGTGIGLTIVQRIITRHGGRIWPESEPGRGTTFHFTLGSG